jgi:hypothetical protein
MSDHNWQATDWLDQDGQALVKDRSPGRRSTKQGDIQSRQVIDRAEH